MPPSASKRWTSVRLARQANRSSVRSPRRLDRGLFEQPHGAQSDLARPCVATSCAGPSPSMRFASIESRHRDSAPTNSGFASLASLALETALLVGSRDLRPCRRVVHGAMRAVGSPVRDVLLYAASFATFSRRLNRHRFGPIVFSPSSNSGSL